MATPSDSKPSAKVTTLRPTNADKTSDKTSDMKWGKRVMKQGFCLIPSILLQAQPRLGLNPTQLAVLLQLCDFWWESDRKPFPSKETIGERLGLGPRQVQRYVADLEAAGLLERQERHASNGGRLTNFYDLSGLVKRLNEIVPDFEEAKEVKRQARRRGGLKSVSAQKTA